LTSAALAFGQQGGILSRAIMSSATFESLADKQMLHLTTIGRVTGLPREIEIWFIVYREKFYLFSEHREAVGWVKNIRRNPNASVRFGRCSMKAVARVLDFRKERQLWDEVQAIADRKYGWGDGLPIEITPVKTSRAE
jgi:deazaflavin-dependent oxidoreductase (nitroreductase family)